MKRPSPGDDIAPESEITPEEAREELRERAAKYQKSGKTRRVRRGYNMNTLRRELQLYGFLGRMEGPPLDDAVIDNAPATWYLQFECVNAQWFDTKMQTMEGDGRLAVVHKFLNNQPFDQAWAAASPAQRHQLSTVYLSYTDDLAAEDPFQGIYECLVNHAYLNQRHIGALQFEEWFKIILVDRPDDQEETNGIFIRMQACQPDVFAGYYDLGYLQRVPEPMQGVLQALHFPNLEPAPPSEPAPPDPPGLGPPPPLGLPVEQDDDGDGSNAMDEGTDRSILDGWMGWLCDAAGRLGECIRSRSRLLSQALRALFRPVPSMELAGMAGMWFPMPEEDLAAPMQYSGHAGPNTMTVGPGGVGGHVPFVGVLDVGQGNLNMIVDSNHHILAYYDFGWSLKGDGPVPVPNLCFCQRPTIILSNFDWDHCGMYKNRLESLGMRWIVPQQKTGTKNVILSLVRQAGGQVCVYPKDGRRCHIAFPWGYIERCTGGGANGSGLAAFVCVRDPHVPHVPPVAGVVLAAPPGALTVSENGTAYKHALSAIASVDARAALPANVDMVKAVAAAFAASNWGTLIHSAGLVNANTNIGDIAIAAVNATTAAVATAASVIAALPDASFHGIRSVDIPTAKQRTADAAIAVQAAAPTPAARGRAAAEAFWNNSPKEFGEPKVWEMCIRNALQPWDPAPLMQAGAAVKNANEGFVMLTGDAFFYHVPSSMDATPPWVVGITAAHHGSRQADGELLTGEGIPWAPGSLQAQAAHAAGAAADVIAAAVAAAMILKPGADRPTVLLATTRAAAAAAVALRIAHGYHQSWMESKSETSRCCASAAAAAAISSIKAADGSLAALSAVVATRVDQNIASTGTIVSYVHQFSIMRRGIPPGLNTANINETGLFHTDIAKSILKALDSLSTPTTHDSSQVKNDTKKATKCMLRKRDNDKWHPVLADIASHAVNCWLSGAGEPQANMINKVGGVNAVHINTANTLPPIDDPPTNLEEMERWAVRLAAAGAAAEASGANPEDVATALQTVAQGRVAQATAVQGLPASQQIVYSYGVRADFRHQYLSPTLGGLGHGHPAAVALYQSKGWHHRFNTSPRANHGQAQGDPTSPVGNAALSWDNAVNTARAGHYTGPPPPPPHTIAYTCPDCGNAITFNT